MASMISTLQRTTQSLVKTPYDYACSVTETAKKKTVQVITSYQRLNAPSSTSIQDVPPEILEYIFTLCSASSLLNVRRVCRQWHDIVQYPGVWREKPVPVSRYATFEDIVKLTELPMPISALKMNKCCLDDELIIQQIVKDMKSVKMITFPSNFKMTEGFLDELYEHWPDLKIFKWNDPKFFPVGTSDVFYSLCRFQCLTSLFLAGNHEIVDDEFIAIITSCRVTLKTLCLDFCRWLTDYSLVELGRLRPNLEVLGLINCAFTEIGYAVIGRLGTLTTLFLTLQRGMDTSFMAYIVQRCPSLCRCTLFTSSCQAEELEEAVTCICNAYTKLRFLGLIACGLSDSCLEKIQNSKIELDTLLLGSSRKITKQGVYDLVDRVKVDKAYVVSCESFKDPGTIVSCDSRWPPSYVKSIIVEAWPPSAPDYAILTSPNVMAK